MRPPAHRLRLILAALLCVFSAGAARAQLDIELQATKRLFPEIGAGVRAIKLGSGARTYVLMSRSVLIFDSAGTKVAEIPAPGTKAPAALIYGEALDVDPAGNIYIADRGTNSIKIYSPQGALTRSVPFASPTGIVALSGGEFAAASATTVHLITVFDNQGKELRSIGDPADLVEDSSLNRPLSIGRMVGDAAGNLYFAFNFVPEPTIRKYDRLGFSGLEIVLNLPAFAPPAQAARREIKRQLQHGDPPHLKPSLSAVGVEPETQRVWLAISNQLLLFSADGQLLVTYRLYTPDGARFEPNSMIIEPDRLIFSSDPMGVYEFPRPDKSVKPSLPEKKPL